MSRLGILGSTRGTNMLALIDAIREKRLPATIELVVSNKSDALILERARSNGLPAAYIDPTGMTREQYDQKISEAMHLHDIDIIVLIGYMRILSAPFVKEWKNKVINVHPSLLPAFAGGMNENVHRAVLESGIKETGCTVHMVTEEVDGGPMLMQKKCIILANDSIESLKSRVQNIEAESLIEVLNMLIKNEEKK